VDFPERTSGPDSTPDSAAPAWISRRTLCVLLLILAVAVGGAFWGEIVLNTLDTPDDATGRTVEPEFFKYAGGLNFDFYQYYAAGHNWSLDLDPYENHPDDARALPHPRHEDKAISGWIYPPTWLPAFGVLADLAYDDARHAWFVLTAVALALTIAVAAARSPGRRLELITAAVLLTICSYPLLYHVHQGQVDLVVACLTVSAYFLYPKWRGWPSAALLAAAILLKVTPVLILSVMVLYFRDWRLLLKTIACLIAGVLLSLAVISPSLYWEYATDIFPRISGTAPNRYNQTLVRFWSSFPAIARMLSVFGFAALLLLAYLAGRARALSSPAATWVQPKTERAAVLLLAILMGLMFSPLSWQMAYAMTIVPMAALLVSTPPRSTVWAPVVLAAGAALMGSQIYNVQVLNMLNVLGAGVAVLALLAWYLPLRGIGATKPEEHVPKAP
jgi:hypothetical protein